MSDAQEPCPKCGKTGFESRYKRSGHIGGCKAATPAQAAPAPGVQQTELELPPYVAAPPPPKPPPAEEETWKYHARAPMPDPELAPEVNQRLDSPPPAVLPPPAAQGAPQQPQRDVPEAEVVSPEAGPQDAPREEQGLDVVELLAMWLRREAKWHDWDKGPLTREEETLLRKHVRLSLNAESAAWTVVLMIVVPRLLSHPKMAPLVEDLMEKLHEKMNEWMGGAPAGTKAQASEAQEAPNPAPAAAAQPRTAEAVVTQREVPAAARRVGPTLEEQLAAEAQERAAIFGGGR